MFNAIILTLAFAATGQVSVEQDFAVLQKRTSSQAEVKQACARIDAAIPDGDAACIKRLVSIWVDHPWSQKETVLLACEKADDKTYRIILDAVRKAFAAADEDREKRRIVRFLGEPAIVLSKRLADPEPVFALAEECHDWCNVGRYEGSQALRDKYIVKSLLAPDSEDGAGGSVASGISDAAIPSVREAMRTLPRDGYLSNTFHGAVSTLVDLSDTEIIPDLEAILRDPKLPVPQQRAFFLYLAKLKHQHSPADLLKIIEGEREYLVILKYATMRYLWLTKDAKTVREALLKNQRKSKSLDINIAQELLDYLFSEARPPSLSSPLSMSEKKYDMQLFILDHDEFREYWRRRETTEDKNTPEFQRWLHEYSVEGIVQAAVTTTQPSKEAPSKARL